MLLDLFNPDEPARIGNGTASALTDQFWKILGMGAKVCLCAPILPTKAKANDLHAPQQFSKSSHRSIICFTFRTMSSGLISANATHRLATEQGFPATQGSVRAW